MSREPESQSNSIASSYRLPTIWMSLASATAVLAGAGSIAGLLMSNRIYGQEMTDLFNAGIAQDLVNLFLVAPLMLIMVVRAFRGSIRSGLCLIGFLAFTSYNYTIYAFTIHFGPLFLVWVAVLGLSLFAFLGSLLALFSTTELKDRFAGIGVRFPGWFLITAAVLFTLLWLSEIVPDLLAGRPSTSAAIWKVPSNPVHILDLAFFLPAVFAAGVLLLRRSHIGFAAAAGSLIFLGLTSLPILVTPFVAQVRGGHPNWSVMAPISLIAVVSFMALWRFLHGMRPI